MTDKTMLSVFQDLKIFSNSQDHTTIRKAILSALVSPFKHALLREEKYKADLNYLRTENNNIVIERNKTDNIPGGYIFLRWEKNCYKVINIVPQQMGQLTRDEYNNILKNFTTEVIEPSSQKNNFSFEITPPNKSLNDYLTEDTKNALLGFSELANKSTGSGHPLDKERWLNFIFKAHKENKRLDGETLGRFLQETLGWYEDVAHDLVVQYEFAMDLLDKKAA